MHCVRSIYSALRYSQLSKLPVKRFVKCKQNVYSLKFFSNSGLDESENVIKELCKDDPALEKKLRIIMLEVEVMRQDGRCAPNYLQSRHWKHLMELPSRSQRSSYLLYLWKTEKSKENEKAKKQAIREKLQSMEVIENKEHPDDLLYGIKHQSLFLRIRDQSINNFDNYRALQAMINGQPIVIDCSYEEHMVYREIMNSAKQMTYVFSDNRIHKDPFDIHMCNVQLQGEFMGQLRRNIPSLEEPWFPMNIHTKSYLDIFPKNKLVYLTPHCRNELTEFDDEAVYIVGCMVDKVNNEPLSLAKAKRDGIQMAKLPLDRYLEWAPGAKKNLNINHMIPILLDLKLMGDWEFALRHVPRRKLMESKFMKTNYKLNNKNLIMEALNVSNYKKNMYNKHKTPKKSLYNDDGLI